MNSPRILKLQFLLTALTAAAIPFASRYPAYTVPITGSDHVMAGAVEADPHYIFRVVWISAGMLMAVASICLTFVALFRKDHSMGQRLLHAVLALLIFNIGWRLFPYYANGLLHIFGNGGTSSAFDPKDLFPGNVAGYVWGVGVMLFYLFLTVVMPLLIIIHLIMAYLRKKAGITELLMIGSYLINFAFIWLTPNYLYWFFD